DGARLRAGGRGRERGERRAARLRPPAPHPHRPRDPRGGRPAAARVLRAHHSAAGAPRAQGEREGDAPLPPARALRAAHGGTQRRGRAAAGAGGAAREPLPRLSGPRDRAAGGADRGILRDLDGRVRLPEGARGAHRGADGRGVAGRAPGRARPRPVQRVQWGGSGDLRERPARPAV
ncbi:MAG: COG2110, Macro domain, possibly ADP-ribose binding module, partial [uncultured Gemmatimonadaceae bacterium]